MKNLVITGSIVVTAVAAFALPAGYVLADGGEINFGQCVNQVDSALRNDLAPGQTNVGPLTSNRNVFVVPPSMGGGMGCPV